MENTKYPKEEIKSLYGLFLAKREVMMSNRPFLLLGSLNYNDTKVVKEEKHITVDILTKTYENDLKMETQEISHAERWPNPSNSENRTLVKIPLL